MNIRMNITLEEVLNHPKTSLYLNKLGIKGKLTKDNYTEISSDNWKQLCNNLFIEKHSFSMNEAMFFVKDVLKIDTIKVINEESGMFSFRLVDRTYLVWNSNDNDNYDLSTDKANIGIENAGSYRMDFSEVEEYINYLKK